MYNNNNQLTYQVRLQNFKITVISESLPFQLQYERSRNKMLTSTAVNIMLMVSTVQALSSGKSRARKGMDESSSSVGSADSEGRTSRTTTTSSSSNSSVEENPNDNCISFFFGSGVLGF